MESRDIEVKTGQYYSNLCWLEIPVTAIICGIVSLTLFYSLKVVKLSEFTTDYTWLVGYNMKSAQNKISLIKITVELYTNDNSLWNPRWVAFKGEY